MAVATEDAKDDIVRLAEKVITGIFRTDEHPAFTPSYDNVEKCWKYDRQAVKSRGGLSARGVSISPEQTPEATAAVVALVHALLGPAGIGAYNTTVDPEADTHDGLLFYIDYKSHHSRVVGQRFNGWHQDGMVPSDHLALIYDHVDPEVPCRSDVTVVCNRRVPVSGGGGTFKEADIDTQCINHTEIHAEIDTPNPGVVPGSYVVMDNRATSHRAPAVRDNFPQCAGILRVGISLHDGGIPNREVGDADADADAASLPLLKPHYIRRIVAAEPDGGPSAKRVRVAGPFMDLCW